MASFGVWVLDPFLGFCLVFWLVGYSFIFGLLMGLCWMWFILVILYNGLLVVYDRLMGFV